jgi:DNA-binding transcriptional LysR family regulator
MQLHDLRVFVTLAGERSFSKAARKLGRTQPAVSQAIRRLEEELGERLVDRGQRDGTLTEAGHTFRDYAQRVLDLTAEAERAVSELRDLKRGRVVIGANEAAVHTLLPLVASFQQGYPDVQIEVRRVTARLMAHEVLSRALDFGVVTFHPAERGLHSLVIGSDELVLLTHPDHPFAKRRTVKMADVAQEAVIAHNDPSPARERVLRAFEQRQTALKITVSLPSLDAIKRAVEMRLGVALLPRRCALSELALGQLAAVRIPELRIPRSVRLIYRQSGDPSHAAEAFLKAAQAFGKSAR